MNAINPHASTLFDTFALPALSPVTRAFPRKPQKIELVGALTMSQSDTGLIVYRGTNPIAWIYAGYHQGQSDNKPKQCNFVDVAYHRQTAYGINLETSDFDTLPQALQFVSEFFGGES